MEFCSVGNLLFFAVAGVFEGVVDFWVLCVVV